MSLPFEKFLVDPSRTEYPKIISSQHACADIDFLIDALIKAYPGKWAMNEVEWDSIIEKLKSVQIDSLVQVSNLGDSLADILWSIPDGHLKVRCGDITCGQYFKNNLRMPSTGNNLVDLDKGDYWKLQTRETSYGTVAILAISRFPQSAESSWNGFSEAIEQILISRHLIVDLRGNAGGDDSKAIELVSALLGYEMDESWVKQVFCETAEAYALQINTYEKIIWNNYRSKNENPPAGLLDHLGKLKNKAIELTNKPTTDDKRAFNPIRKQFHIALTRWAHRRYGAKFNNAKRQPSVFIYEIARTRPELFALWSEFYDGKSLPKKRKKTMNG